MSKRRVVVTGLGIVSPVGNTIPEAWDNLVAGRSGIARITRFDPSPFTAQIGGEVKDFDVGQYLNPKEARRMDVFIQFGMAAGIQAMRDSGIEVTEANAERIGVNIGSGIGGLPLIEETHTLLMESGPRKISPFFIPGSIINMISGNLSIQFGLKGPNLAVVTACATGLHAIGLSARMIEHGDADVMVAGGAECATSPLGLGGFAAGRGRFRCRPCALYSKRRPGNRQSPVGQGPRWLCAGRRRRRDGAGRVRARQKSRRQNLR